jgi:hypothetical protein
MNNSSIAVTADVEGTGAESIAPVVVMVQAIVAASVYEPPSPHFIGATLSRRP